MCIATLGQSDNLINLARILLENNAKSAIITVIGEIRMIKMYLSFLTYLIICKAFNQIISR